MNRFQELNFYTIALMVIAIGAVSYLLYSTVTLKHETAAQSEMISILESNLASTTSMLDRSLTRLSELGETLDLTTREKEALSVDLDEQKEVVGAMTQQIKETTETLTILEKLAATDEELLQKYSRIFFLNEHYFPKDLIQIQSPDKYYENRETWIHPEVWPYLSNLLSTAEEIGNPVQVVSGYRSFETQSELNDAYAIVYGEGTANKFSADQGYSEHQLGTTVDLTTPSLGAGFQKFGNTDAFEWMMENAHTFGFILSYPKNNKFYVYEPWHWRYVGVLLATELYNSQRGFYDVDQREIDEYLISIF